VHEVELVSFFTVESTFFSVFSNDVVVVLDLAFKGDFSVVERISLVGQVSKFMIPSRLFSVFPALISSSGSLNLALQSRDQLGDLSEELWVLRRGSDLSERGDEWLVSSEFVVKVGHFFKSLSDTLDSSLELDEKSTSAHGGEEVHGVLASGDSVSMFLVEFRPGSVFHISLSLTSFDSADNRSEFLNG